MKCSHPYCDDEVSVEREPRMVATCSDHCLALMIEAEYAALRWLGGQES